MEKQEQPETPSRYVEKDFFQAYLEQMKAEREANNQKFAASEKMFAANDRKFASALEASDKRFERSDEKFVSALKLSQIFELSWSKK